MVFVFIISFWQQREKNSHFYYLLLLRYS